MIIITEVKVRTTGALLKWIITLGEITAPITRPNLFLDKPIYPTLFSIFEVLVKLPINTGLARLRE